MRCCSAAALIQASQKNVFACDAKEDSEILGVPNDEMQIHLMLVIAMAHVC